MSAIWDMQFSLFVANGYIFQKEPLKRCLPEHFLKDLSSICNFNTPACATDHILP